MASGQLESESAERMRGLHQAETTGRLILLAEDNETNQVVMTAQLSNLGYTTILAADGGEAFELWKRHSFAMILTDCSMPAVDGFELAASIRMAEKNTGTHTPIVAITANAVADNKTQCAESGMDDCIFKPVDMNVLRSVLEKWLARDNRPALIDASVAEQRAGIESRLTFSPIDPEILTNLVGGDPAMCHRMLLKYRDTSPDVFTALSRASAQGELSEVVAEAHKLKSSSRTIGAVQLAELIQLVEDAGRNSRNDEVSKLAPQLEEEFDRVINYINELPCYDDV